MKRGIPALLPLLPLLACSACSIHVDLGDGDETETETESGSSSDDASSSDASSSSSDSSDSSDSDSSSSDSSSSSTETAGSDTAGSDATGSDSDTTGSDSDTTDSGSDTTDTGIEEPPPGYCGMSPGPVDPWFELTQDEVPIGESGHFDIQCDTEGGSFLFVFDAELGGFAPNGKLVQFHVVMDVDGFNIGPNGHFAEKDFEIFIGCCPEDYDAYPIQCLYDPKPFILSPPAILDPGVLDGLPATLDITMTTIEGDTQTILDVDVWAMQEPDWVGCGVYDLQPLEIGLPIPLG